MQVYIYRNNNQSGPHDEEVIKGQLRSGGLSPTDRGCRVGDTQWVQLGDMFPDAVPQAAAAPVVATAPPVAEQAVKKSGGCRVALGTIMLVFGLLMFFGGVGLAILTPFAYDMPLCPIAESDWAKVQDTKKQYDAATDETEKASAEYDLKRAMDSYESSSAMCASERGTRQLFIIGFVAAAIIGALSAIIGFFLRRVRPVP